MALTKAHSKKISSVIRVLLFFIALKGIHKIARAILWMPLRAMKKRRTRMTELIFLLCALVSAMCTLVLLRGYRRTGNRLLLWGALCFGVLTLNNTFLC